MKTSHADIVGSLLRPDYLLKARQDYIAGIISPSEFIKLEDRAVNECVSIQEQVGLEIISDGEMRRGVFADQVVQATTGFGKVENNRVDWFDLEGKRIEDPVTVGLVSQPLRKRFPSVEELCYLRGRTDKQIKVTIPSPTMYGYYYVPGISNKIYASTDDFLANITSLISEEVSELVRIGARYIQFDAPEFGMLIDPHQQAWFKAKGFESKKTIQLGIKLMNSIIEQHPDITFGLHVCKGNDKNRYMAKGGYDPVASLIFPKTKAQILLLEYDDERSGDFKPLEQVPDDKVVVLGLISTKRSKLENKSDVIKRIEEASTYIPMERLAISTQCGFASVAEGNHLSFKEQKAKLKLIVDIANQVWK